MNARLIFALFLTSLGAGCSDGSASSVEPTRDYVREWANKPISELDDIPGYARACFGSHFALLTEPEAGLPADVLMVCGRAVPVLEGTCQTYAREAAKFAEVATNAARASPQWSAAERRANVAFGRCVRAV